MKNKILALIGSLLAIIIGVSLSANSNRIFYGLVLAGIAYSIYNIYLIATHKKTTLKQQENQHKLETQSTFDSKSPIDSEIKPENVSVGNSQTQKATIIVSWFKEKMGLGAMPIYINGVLVGAIQKNNLRIVYETNVPFNIICMGPYIAEIELAPGDTVEYYCAGNGIRHDRTKVTRAEK